MKRISTLPNFINTPFGLRDNPDGWIINEICRSFNVTEVTE